jgi:subfamily B ATP-binding cassette protein MsbA
MRRWGSRFCLRLLRYGLPYSLQWLPGVLLLAMVGVLDTFRILLLQPIFDQVLRPDAPRRPHHFSGFPTANGTST